MENNEVVLRTRHKGAKYGTMGTVDGRNVVIVKSRKKEDFITAEEIIEDLYGKPVDHIVFKEEQRVV